MRRVCYIVIVFAATMKSCFVGIVVIVAVLHSAASYSKEENEFNRQSDLKRKPQGRFSEDDGLNELPAEKYDPDFRNLQKPFRMAKLNLVWTKAQQVSYENFNGTM